MLKFSLQIVSCKLSQIFKLIQQNKIEIEMIKSQDSMDRKSKKIGKGEFELHVLVEATSGLSLNDQTAYDIKIGVTAFGRTEYTKVKTNIGMEETFWGEHFYFVKNFENSQQAEHERVLIGVYDYNKIISDTLVGSFQIDVQRIYSQAEHTMKHMWLVLSNKEKNFGDITGYVKISACVLGENDQNVQLENEASASITTEKKLLVPPEIHRTSYQVIVEILQGLDVKPTDGKSVDPFVGVEFGQIYSTSEIVSKNRNPEFMSKVYLPISIPSVVQNIALRLQDMNIVNKTELIGSYYVNINNLIKYQQPQNPVDSRFVETVPINSWGWVNFYGPQIKTVKAEQAKYQGLYPSQATYYVGSLLMKIAISEETSPKASKQRVDDSGLRKVMKNANEVEFYEATFRVTAGINLPNRSKNYRVAVKVGDEQYESSSNVAKNGFCFWDTVLTLPFKVRQMQTVPDIFVYLVDASGSKICYHRLKPKLGQVLEDQWVPLKTDRAMIDLCDDQAGYIKLQVNINKGSHASEKKTSRALSKMEKFYAENRRSGRLVVSLFCCESLLPLDEEGSIDAYFTFRYLNYEVKSAIVNDSLNPIFNQRLVIETDIQRDYQSLPPIIVSAFDNDKMADQFLGVTFIEIGEAMKKGCLIFSSSPTNEPKPFWYELKNNNMVTGKYLVSFEFIANYNGPIPKQISLAKKQYEMLLVVMGLRGLKNTGVVSVKQPYIQFNFAGLETESKSLQFNRENKIVTTEPKEKGRSININTIIPARVKLPTAHEYWPFLSAKVKDNVLGTFYQPLLGHFSINLKDAYKSTSKVLADFEKKQTPLKNRKPITQADNRLKDISKQVLLSLRNFLIKSLNYSWKTLEPGMKDLLNKPDSKSDRKLNQKYIVLFPQYTNFGRADDDKDAKEKANEKKKWVEQNRDIILANGNYMQIGFDTQEVRGKGLSERNKHYRLVLNEPYDKYYERVNKTNMGSMREIPIRSGRVFLDNSFSSNITKSLSKEDTEAGIYKGHLLVFEGQQDEKMKKFIDESKETLKVLTNNGKIHMFLYIIEAANLPPKDQFSHSDPYLVVKAGQQKVDLSKQFLEDEPNPQFFKKIHMILQFPNDSAIDIEVWDYDPIKADELIGTCTIDIENRVQSRLTDLNFNSPIETHSLRSSISKRSQGLIRFWLDLVPVDSISLYKEFEISRKISSQFQIRIIVWGVKGIPNNDFEDMNDLYVTCTFNNQEQSTDVHYRTSTGEGYYNWRMVFPVSLPIRNSFLSFKVFDQDLLTSNDCLASTSFSIQSYLEEAFETDSSTTLYLGTQDLSVYSDVKTGKKRVVDGKEYYDRFDIPLNTMKRNQSSLDKMLSETSKLEVSIQILTEADARSRPAASGRKDPNQYPTLPEPKRSLEFTLNPFKLLGQFCGPAFKRKMGIVVCLLLILALIVFFGVNFSGALVGALVGK